MNHSSPCAYASSPIYLPWLYITCSDSFIADTHRFHSWYTPLVLFLVTRLSGNYVPRCMWSWLCAIGNGLSLPRDKKIGQYYCIIWKFCDNIQGKQRWHSRSTTMKFGMKTSSLSSYHPGSMCNTIYCSLSHKLITPCIQILCFSLWTYRYCHVCWDLHTHTHTYTHKTTRMVAHRNWFGSAVMSKLRTQEYAISEN
jgi:hypothetical protein